MNHLRRFSPPPRSGLVSNVLWLIFALSFIWFPYLGMVTFPCRHKDEKAAIANQGAPWSPYGKPELGNFNVSSSSKEVVIS